MISYVYVASVKYRDSQEHKPVDVRWPGDESSNDATTEGCFVTPIKKETIRREHSVIVDYQVSILWHLKKIELTSGNKKFNTSDLLLRRY